MGTAILWDTMKLSERMKQIYTLLTWEEFQYIFNNTLKRQVQNHTQSGPI